MTKLTHSIVMLPLILAGTCSWTEAQSGNQIHFIRQTQYPTGFYHDFAVSTSGETMAQLPLDSAGSKFELWSVDSASNTSYLLDSTVVGAYLPMATLAIRSEDPYSEFPRTRADRSFYVDLSVGTLMSGSSDAPVSKSISLYRHVQSYGPTGDGVGLDRTQATQLSQASITTNGLQTFSYSVTSLPGVDRSKVRGEERFSAFTLASDDAPSLAIDSKTIQIWPVADGKITGITQGQTIVGSTPQITFTLHDLYPSSRTYAQVYQGDPQSGVVGTIVPGTNLVINNNAPSNRTLIAANYDSVFSSDGLWTMELLTETPFGTDRLDVISFSIQDSGNARESWRQTHFGTIDNSAAGADLNDFDHDGIVNLIEFAFGLDPKANSADLLPAPLQDGDNQVIHFTQPAGVADIIYQAEWSETLLPGSWNPIINSAVPPMHSFSVPIDSKPKLYMRLKVTSP